jgi:formate hydrogenlyase subunit 6/NADH:ubiquinone oxidoreductase subunit I
MKIVAVCGSPHKGSSTECILCLECTNVCPKGALAATFGLDAGNRDLLKVRADESPNRS